MRARKNQGGAQDCACQPGTQRDWGYTEHSVLLKLRMGTRMRRGRLRPFGATSHCSCGPHHPQAAPAGPFCELLLISLVPFPVTYLQLRPRTPIYLRREAEEDRGGEGPNGAGAGKN